LLVRLQVPRFLVEGDEVTLSAIIHSELPEPARVRVRLELEHPDFELPGERWGELASPETELEVSPGAEVLTDWRVRVRCPGLLNARIKAWTQGASDGMELTLPVLQRGVQRTEVVAGELREGDEGRVTIELPQQRRPGSAEVLVRVTPSLAATVVDALPYLLDYPYGCVEQTASRFVPAALVARLLQELQVTLPGLADQARLLREREQSGRMDDEPVEFTPYTAPDGRAGLLTLAGRTNAAFEPQKLESVIRASLRRLRRAQSPTGGWGWWPGGRVNLEITAYVLEGLLHAATSGVTLPEGMVTRAQQELERQLTARLREPQFRPGYADLAAAGTWSRAGADSEAVMALAERALQARLELSVKGKAVLARLLCQGGRREAAEMLLRNLESTLRVDAHTGTAWWEMPTRGSWWWEWNPVETTAAALEAYLEVAPGSPVPLMLVRWLVRNRRGAAWRSTRETALAVQALLAYARSTRELEPDYTLALELGDARAEYRVRPEAALTAAQLFVVDDSQLQTGRQTLTLRRSGTGPVYYTVLTRYFSQEDPIPASGYGIRVTRRFFRVSPTAVSTLRTRVAQAVPRPYFGANPFLSGELHLLDPAPVSMANSPKAPPTVRIPMVAGDQVATGELLEVELSIEADNQYGYLLIEDIKPAGTEPVDPRSGYHGEYAGAYVEFRDQKVAFFLEQVPQGLTRFSYRTRVELPGQLHVLPVQCFAMYAPEIRSISDEQRLMVHDG
jgi:uncharacterized protein YfaS (alpha-2-macroglobulin family)